MPRSTLRPMRSSTGTWNRMSLTSSSTRNKHGTSASSEGLQRSGRCALKRSTDSVAALFGEVAASVLTGGDPRGLTRGGRYRVLGDQPGSCNFTDLVPRLFCEPEIPIRTGGDAQGLTGSGGYRELSHHSGDGDSTELVRGALSEPKVAVGANRDGLRTSRR